MKKYVKAIIVVHVLMVAALMSSGWFAIVIDGLVVSTEVVTAQVLGQEAVIIGLGAIAGNTAAIVENSTDGYVAMGAVDTVLLYGYAAVPVIGPVLAALEYFDVTDFVDWF